uniref:adenylate kinase n=1 Tax=Rhizophora mucronata TaxID=61149 RepID=A0A2P2P1Z0_RHIMU
MATAGDALNMEELNGNDVQNFRVVVILGGPGSGKGTQCARIAQQFGYTHLSSGEILRKASKSGSKDAVLIGNMLKEGLLVPPEITVPLVREAMEESGNNKFVFDGFPRDEETRALFERSAKIEPNLVLLFDCPDEELERRSLGRNEGRDDDVTNTIRKRIKVFRESTVPVIQYYDSKKKLRKVDARKSKEEVFRAVRPFFIPKDENSCCCSIM